METVLRIIAALSFVAFVVGMFSPKTVKCSSRGKVALVYLGIFFVSIFAGASLMENSSEEVSLSKIKENVAEMKKIAKEENSKSEKPTEIPVLGKGSVYTMAYANNNVLYIKIRKTSEICKYLNTGLLCYFYHNNYKTKSNIKASECSNGCCFGVGRCIR